MTKITSRTIAEAQAQFVGGRRYLASCTVGLPSRGTRAAVVADLDSATAGAPDIEAYSRAVENSRSHFARLVGVAPQRVAIGSQASTTAALLTHALPDAAEVLVPECEFSSIVLPFVHAGKRLRVRSVPLASLASEISSRTALVAFSVVQSATGDIADTAAIARAARAHDVLTLCDATQAVGWLTIDASQFDAVICHTYKWLCAPRGVSFLTVSHRLQEQMPPLFAGWYAGADPWSSCYGGDATLASDARRFDVSPAWQAFVGAEPALALFAGLDSHVVHEHVTTLSRSFRELMNLARPEHFDPAAFHADSAIITWADPNGSDVARLSAAGIVASGRAGRARVAFHVYNDGEDVAIAIDALTH